MAGTESGTRILVIEDHPLVATGLQLTLRSRGYSVEQISGPTRDAVLARAVDYAPECVLLDLRLDASVGHGIGLIPDLVRLGAAVILVTAETDELTLGECVEAGATGWVHKSEHVDEVVRAIDTVLDGRPLIPAVRRETLLDRVRDRRTRLRASRSPFEQLTPREQAVLGALIEGMSADEISEHHVVSMSTVRSQIRAILQKLGVRSQLAAVVMATRAGWKPEVDDQLPSSTNFPNSDDVGGAPG